MTYRELRRPVLQAALAAVWLAACASYEANEPHQRRLTIAPDPVPCGDGTPGSCLSVTDANGDQWITGQNEIEGFTYQPGFRYELLVEEASADTEMEDPTPPRLRLIEVVSREASGAAGPALDADLGGTHWVLSAIEPSDHPASAWAASGITAEFDPSGGRVSGFAGCNNYTAALAVSGDQMEVSQPASTRKACRAQAAAELEQEYLQRIATTTAFAVTGDRLNLSLSDGSGMAFQAKRP
jgi:heat shock protein HslJ